MNFIVTVLLHLSIINSVYASQMFAELLKIVEISLISFALTGGSINPGNYHICRVMGKYSHLIGCWQLVSEVIQFKDEGF